MKLIGWLGLNMKLIGWLGLNMKLIGWLGKNMKLDGVEYEAEWLVEAKHEA